ncbi:hypothetical protein J6590_019342 [Homalodisca vitripennis]|nr:hypothetical protein J6590_019342 [Homalodisca vitripennis]
MGVPQPGHSHRGKERDRAARGPAELFAKPDISVHSARPLRLTGTEPRVARPSCLRNPIPLYTQINTAEVMFAIYCRSLQVRLDLGYHSSASKIDRDSRAWPGRVVCETRYLCTLRSLQSQLCLLFTVALCKYG